MATATKTKGAAKEQNPVDEQPEVSLRDQIRERFQAGGDENTRSKIAKDFGLKYQQVYAYTKDMGEGEGSGGRARVMVEVNGEQRPRVEVIREMFANGEKVGAIAKELGVSYQIVYQATKNQRPSKDEADEAEATEEGTEDLADEVEGEELDEEFADEESEDQ